MSSRGGYESHKEGNQSYKNKHGRGLSISLRIPQPTCQGRPGPLRLPAAQPTMKTAEPSGPPNSPPADASQKGVAVEKDIMPRSDNLTLDNEMEAWQKHGRRRRGRARSPSLTGAVNLEWPCRRLTVASYESHLVWVVAAVSECSPEHLASKLSQATMEDVFGPALRRHFAPLLSWKGECLDLIHSAEPFAL